MANVRTQVTRCPYCVEGDNFRVMQAKAGGDWREWEQCAPAVFAHLFFQTSHKCACTNCSDLEHSLGR